jgi:hypothetical protein
MNSFDSLASASVSLLLNVSLGLCSSGALAGNGGNFIPPGVDTCDDHCVDDDEDVPSSCSARYMVRFYICTSIQPGERIKSTASAPGSACISPYLGDGSILS